MSFFTPSRFWQASYLPVSPIVCNAHRLLFFNSIAVRTQSDKTEIHLWNRWWSLTAVPIELRLSRALPVSAGRDIWRDNESVSAANTRVNALLGWAASPAPPFFS